MRAMDAGRTACAISTSQQVMCFLEQLQVEFTMPVFLSQRLEYLLHWQVSIDSLRYTSALSVALVVVFLVVTAGITVYKLLSGNIMMPRLLPEATDLTSVLKLFTAVPVLVTAYICHYNGYVDVGKLELSPNRNYLAYTPDTTGDERFMLQVKNLETGIRENFRVDDVDQLVWAQDNCTLFYTVFSEYKRPCRVDCYTPEQDPINNVKI